MAKKSDVNSVQITFRAPEEVIKRLDELCSMGGMKRSEFFIYAINSEFDRINGNPQLKKMLEQMREISDAMQYMNHYSSSSGSSGGDSRA